MSLGDLYREVDRLLALRAEDYPRRVEPRWSALRSGLREVADELWRVSLALPEPEAPERSALVALAERPVFVVGYYKSGTTLLLNLLDGHPEFVVLPGESKHFTGLARELGELPSTERIRCLHSEWIRRVIAPAGVPPFWTLGEPWRTEDDPYLLFSRHLAAFARRRGEQDLLAAVAQALAATRNSTPRFWAEKTPTHEFHLTEIRAAYREALFVHIVRDPLSVVEALRRYGKEQHVVDSLTAAAELARSFAVADAERQASHRYLVVRYEDLVEAPETTLRAIARFLRVGYDDALLTPTVSGRPATANASSRSRRVVGEIRRLSEFDRVVPWRLAVAVAALAGPKARKFGYALPVGSRMLRLALRGELWRRFRLRLR